MSDDQNPIWCQSCGAVFTPPQKCDCERAGMSELANHTPQISPTVPIDLDPPAKIWSNAPFPSKASKAKAQRAILAFINTLPEQATIADLKYELEQWS